MIITMAILGSSGFFYIAPAEAPMVPETQAQIFDREDCNQQCAYDYGFDLYRFGGGGGWDSSLVREYQRCLERCDQKYWNSYDREMDELDRK